MARIALIGASGRMGKLAKGLIEDSTEHQLVCELSKGAELSAALKQSEAQAGIDFTVAGLGAQHGLAMLEAGVAPVIGTSGVTLQEDKLLDEAATAVGLAGLVVPNFCLGVWLQQELARRAAEFYGSVEIIEEHHACKPDAPSGTAADTARQLAALLPGEGTEVPIHSVRLEGLFSNQEVLFGGTGEVLRIRHETFGLEAFGPGILASIAYVLGASPGVRRGIGHALESAGCS